MLVKTALVALMGLAVVAESASVHHTPTLRDRLARRQNRQGGGGAGVNKGKTGGNGGGATGGNGGNGGNNGNAGTGTIGASNDPSVTCLAADTLQTGSFSTGQNNDVAADGQTNSKTDPANFINFCKGKLLTNGLQQKGGSCNGIVMGDIPSTNNMVSTIITNPPNGGQIPANTTFNIALSIAHLNLGFFTNATSTYYSAPQAVDPSNGDVIGHTHVTVQSLGNSANPSQPPDGRLFAFFKGINDAGDGKGNVNTTVTGGLPPGFYRVCSMNGASNHQPVLMPVAQRGTPDDCNKFEVVANGGGGNNGGNGGNAGAGGNNGGKGGAGNNAGGTNNAASGADGGSSTSSSAASATSAAAGNGGQGGGKGQNGGGKGQGGGKGSGAGAGNAASSTVASSSAAAATTSAAASTGGQGGGKGNNGGFGGKGQGGGKGNNAATTTASSAAAAATTTSSAAAAATTSAAASSGSGSGKGGSSGSTGGGIGGIGCPKVSKTGGQGPFQVGGDTFVNESAAKQRACAMQNNMCADAVNAGKVAGKSVADCNAQQQACEAGPTPF